MGTGTPTLPVAENFSMSDTISATATIRPSEMQILPGTCVPFDAICETGCYISNWSGELLRVTPDGLTAINTAGSKPLFATKISHNPQITITKARLLAANYDLPANF